MFYQIKIFLIFMIFCPLLTFAEGEYLSKKDMVFLNELRTTHEETGNLGGEVTLLVNGFRYPVNKGILAFNSLVFKRMFTNGMKESQTTENEIEIKEVHEDVFIKVIRLIYHREFDKFDRSPEVNWALTTQLLNQLNFFGLEKLKSFVYAKVNVDDQVCFKDALKIADSLDPSDSKRNPILSKCMKFLSKKSGYIDPHLVVEYLGEDYFEKNPAFYRLMKRIARETKKNILVQVNHPTLGPSIRMPSGRFLMSDRIRDSAGMVMSVSVARACQECANRGGRLPLKEDFIELRLALGYGSETGYNFSKDPFVIPQMASDRFWTSTYKTDTHAERFNELLGDFSSVSASISSHFRCVIDLK